jgi:hypothetical protein
MSAWLRLGDARFENRAHFFGGAAEAMRRILIERARRQLAAKHGAGAEHVDANDIELAAPKAKDDELLSPFRRRARPCLPELEFCAARSPNTPRLSVPGRSACFDLPSKS